MTGLLMRLFIGKNPDSGDPKIRSACGKLAGLVGICCNLLLFAGKLAAGIFSGSVSITADAINNLSDASGSIVTLLGFKMAEKPADADHPYGHARMEYLTGLAVAALILLIGVELGKTSIERIVHPQPVEFSWLLVALLLASIAVKLWMAVFYRTVGKRIASPALAAASADSRNDVISTTAVLAACIVGRLTRLQIDGWMGLGVAAFILYSVIGIAKDTIDPLLGKATDPALVKIVADEIHRYEKVLGIHDLMVHDYGPNRRFASVHVEMDMHEDPMVCHDIIDDIERDFKKNHHIDLVIHYDPIVTDDVELNHMHQTILSCVHEVDPRLKIHDFRMVRGPSHTNLIFDLVIPYHMQGREKELEQRIDHKIKAENPRYYAVVTFDEAEFDPEP